MARLLLHWLFSFSWFIGIDCVVNLNITIACHCMRSCTVFSFVIYKQRFVVLCSPGQNDQLAIDVCLLKTSQINIHCERKCWTLWQILHNVIDCCRHSHRNTHTQITQSWMIRTKSHRCRHLSRSMTNVLIGRTVTMRLNRNTLKPSKSSANSKRVHANWKLNWRPVWINVRKTSKT